MPSTGPELGPVKSSHWVPSCAGKENPPEVYPPFTTETTGPNTVQPVMALLPVAKLEKLPIGTSGVSKLPFMSSGVALAGDTHASTANPAMIRYWNGCFF